MQEKQKHTNNRRLPHTTIKDRSGGQNSKYKNNIISKTALVDPHLTSQYENRENTF